MRYLLLFYASFGPIKISFIVLLLCLFLLPFGPTLNAAQPDDGRPYLELPFPGETSYRVTCAYECYQHKGSMYYAVDFAIPEGDPIVAAAAGEVMAVTWEIGLPADLNLGDALILYLDHGNGWFTRYVHLDGVTVEVGDEVEMGDVIGYGGKTGAMGNHLHFELKHGTSLHSKSVPINELFGGREPSIGQFYTSNNWTLENRALANKLKETPLATETPTPTLALPPTEEPSATPTLVATEELLASPTAIPTLPPTPSATVTPEESVEEIVLWHKPQVQDSADIITREALPNTPTITPSVTLTATTLLTVTTGLTTTTDVTTTAGLTATVELSGTTEVTTTEKSTAVSVAPQINQSTYLLPRIEDGLSLSATNIEAGERITATFTLRNTTEERLHLNLLGVAARPVGEIAPLGGSLFFDRFIVLNPGRSYEFTKSYTFDKTGELELFVFALDMHNEWIPLDGMSQIAPLNVGSRPTTLFLPIITH